MFRIVTDTSSNLPTAYLQAENITVIPFTFPILHGEEAVGVVDLVSKKAYDVSGKEIAQAAKEQLNMEIDKKKLVLPEPLKTFGTHQVSIKLHKDVTGTLAVKVVEA